MINKIKEIVNVITNKEGRGELTPPEFDDLLYVSILELFNEYLDKYKQSVRQNNRGLGSKGLADATLGISSKLSTFRFFNKEVAIVEGLSSKPKDVAYIDSISLNDVSVTILEHGLTRINQSKRTRPTAEFPVCVFDGDFLSFVPVSSGKAILSGIRFPKKPKWTYREIGNGYVFNPSAGDFQDVELHETEIPSIVYSLCSLIGIRLKDNEVNQVMELLKDKKFQKENM